jgi:hypothetical protein
MKLYGWSVSWSPSKQLTRMGSYESKISGGESHCRVCLLHPWLMRQGMLPAAYAYPKFVFCFVLLDAKGSAVFICVSLSEGFPYSLRGGSGALGLEADAPR